MSVLAAILTQIVHIAAVLCAAPVLAGLTEAAAALRAGRAPPPLLAPLARMKRMLRKQAIAVEGTTALIRMAPVLSVLLAAIPAFLIPSFATGMISAPWSDTLTVAALFVLGRLLVVLVAMDSGTGAGGLAATRAAGLAVFSEPAWLLAAFVLSLLAGGHTLDAVLAARTDGLLPAGPAAGLAIAALALIGWSERREPSSDALFSGADRALLQLAASLRLLALCDLIGALALPFGMAASVDGPLAWAIGLFAWAGRLLLAAVLLAVLDTTAAPRRAWTIVVLALLLCGTAVALGLAGGDPA
jgi:formate hydrogenlyase subunit 4